MSVLNKKVSGFKGFDKDLKCRDVQYEVGKKYEHKGELSICASGIHYCEHPLDVFGYYPPAISRYAEVEAEGVSDQRDGDSKRVCSSLFVKAEITLQAMIQAAVSIVFKQAKMETVAERAAKAKGASSDEAVGAASATGDQGAASATGYQGAASATGVRGAASATGVMGAASATGVRGAASATGYQGAASATGDQGAASATGVRGAAVALGFEGKVRGVVGSWLTAAEWKPKSCKCCGDERIDVQTVRVDGKKIKAETWYWLKHGKFVEVS